MTKQEFNDTDIAQAWQKLAVEKFNQLTINKDDIMDAIKMESQSSITELKKRIKYKLFWSAGFSLAFLIILLFFLGNMDMVLLIGFGVVAYAIGFFGMFVKYKQINTNISDSSDILRSMKYNAKMIKSVLRLEKTWGLILFIPAITLAILAGKVIGGATLAASLQDVKTLSIILGAVIIFTPLLIWSSNKMNRFAFGKHLEQLEHNIVKMETLQ